MTTKEKILYHQIHPLKLFIDISTGLFTTYLAWEHELAWFLIFFLLPSVIITLLLFEYADLERLKNSSSGKYVEQYMTTLMTALRLGGQIMMWVAAWFHWPMIIILGALLIIRGWSHGLILRAKEKS